MQMALFAVGTHVGFQVMYDLHGRNVVRGSGDKTSRAHVLGLLSSQLLSRISGYNLLLWHSGAA